MTVSTAYSPLSFAGNGATTAFAVTWPFFTGTLAVTLISSTGVETVQTLTTHYTVSGGTDANGLPGTGTVTMLTAPVSGATLRITRSTAKTQASTWSESDGFPQKTVEAALDKLTLLAQENAGAGDANDNITGDVLSLNSAGAQDYWDGEDNPLSRIPFLEITEGSAPSTPDSGRGRLYVKTDGDLYYKNDAGEEGNVSDAATAAAISAAAAATSATNAATSATTASTQATNAATSATNASTSATNAETSATTATTQATNAATSATSAATSATNAAAAVGFLWTYSMTTTMADPGTGVVRFNNAALASVTAIAIDDLSADTGNPDVSARVVTWDDSTNTNKGTLLFRKQSAVQNWVEFTVTGLTDNAGWTQLAVTYVGSSGSLSDSDTLLSSFTRSGDKGTDGVGSGDVSAASSFGTDNRLIRSDGTTKNVQASGVTLDDSDNVSGIAALSATSIELGHASDTTISRAGAGAIAVEGVGVALNSTSLTHTAGTIELGHATDTTLSRNSAGEVDIEGNRVWTQSNIGARINALTTDGSPDTAADYVATYDASAGGPKKVLLSLLGGSTAASQAEQETGSLTTVFTSPGRQQFHPSAAKAWVRFNIAGTVAASYNITSVTDNGPGDWTVNIATDFSSANYCGVAFGGQGETATARIFNMSAAAAAGTFRVVCNDVTDNPADPSVNEIYAVFFGDQA